MNSEILATLDNETQIRVLASTLNGGKLTDAQKQDLVDTTKQTLLKFTIESNVKEYCSLHPDALLERMFPPIDTKGFPDGKITITTQENMAKALALVFNCVNGKETDMWVISDNLQEDFLSGNWLHDVPTVDSALKKRNSRGKSRRAWYDVCRQLCRVFEITDTANKCDWPQFWVVEFLLHCP